MKHRKIIGYGIAHTEREQEGGMTTTFNFLKWVDNVDISSPKMSEQLATRHNNERVEKDVKKFVTLPS